MLHGSRHWKLPEELFGLQGKKAQLENLWTKKVSVTFSSKTVQLATTVSVSMVDTQSAALFVSVHGDEFRDTPPTNTEAAIYGSCEN